LRVLYVRTPVGKSRLLPWMGDGNRDNTASAPAVAVLAGDTVFSRTSPHGVPGPAGHPGGLRGGLQIGYFLLAVRAVGLAAGPMAGFDRDGIDREFFPDGRFKSLLVVNIGHPGENPWFPRLPRLPHDTAVTWA
jgi:3-hydroxypropanoate dehydrogenase